VFKASLGDHKALIHEPDVFGDRGPIVGYYAVVKYTDGETDFEPLTVAQAHAIRDRSDGYKAFSDGKIKSTPWSSDEVEMSKKTAIRRLTKRIPQSPELAEAIQIEDAAEHGGIRAASDVALSPPVPPTPPSPHLEIEEMGTPSSPVDAFEDQGEEIIDRQPKNSEPPSPDDITDIDPSTGEVIDEPSDSDFFYALEESLMKATSMAGIAIAWDTSGVETKFASSPGDMDTCLGIKARAVKKVKEAASS
jgi:recombination protein RecT